MLAGASCWVLYVDVLVLEMGGEHTMRKCNWKEGDTKYMLENAPHLLIPWGWGLRTGEKYKLVSFYSEVDTLFEFHLSDCLECWPVT